jgi:hypothetical protein
MPLPRGQCFEGTKEFAPVCARAACNEKKRKQEQNKLYVGVTGLGGVQARRVVMHYATLCHKQKKRVWPSATARLMHSEVRRLATAFLRLGRSGVTTSKPQGLNTNARCLEHFCPIIARMSQPRQTHGTAVVRQIRGAHPKRGCALMRSPQYMVETTSRIRVGRHPSGHVGDIVRDADF